MRYDKEEGMIYFDLPEDKVAKDRWSLFMAEYNGWNSLLKRIARLQGDLETERERLFEELRKAIPELPKEFSLLPDFAKEALRLNLG